MHEIFKKLRPGIPLKCMHGRMKYEVQQAIVAEFSESTSVLFSTDIFARGLDIGNVDWVIQVYLSQVLIYCLKYSCCNLVFAFVG